MNNVHTHEDYANKLQAVPWTINLSVPFFTAPMIFMRFSVSLINNVHMRILHEPVSCATWTRNSVNLFPTATRVFLKTVARCSSAHGSSDRSFMVNTLSNFSFYPVCRVVHIKDPLLLIGKSSPFSGNSRFPLLLYEWSFTIHMTPYNRK